MALSDLELLSLVERAQEAKQGPIGPQGVGIRSIEQPDPFTVVISLTDGRTKEINLTAGPKGDPGEAGKPGRDGAEGRPGSAGKAGAAGIGVAGAPGAPGTSIDTAIVNADGNLLLGLTDGNVLNVGRVVGPAGATGPTGPTGLPGRAGRDGNTILSAPHAPADNEGNPGDFWIDTSSPLFDFYAKGSSGWRKLTSLRAPQTPVGGKMSSGGGMSGNGGSGGGGELQNTATLPLANPSRYKNHGRALPPSDGLKSQKDLNEWVYSVLLGIDDGTSSISVGPNPPDPAEVGMLWFSTDESALFIYVNDESGWLLASPVEEVYVSPTPPANPSEGKLWYDSSGDVIELFIYVNDAWVSATPNSEYALESRIAVNEQGIRDLWSDQTRQDFEIAGLDTRVDALEGVVGQYRYIIQTANATPRDGQLAFLKGDMSTTTRWADATSIAVNPNALGGEVWPTSEVVTGDVLRFHLKGDITMEVSAFEAKVVQNNNNLFSIDSVVKEVGTIMDGAEYEAFHLSSFDPSGLATMDYVDAQDSNLKDYTDGQIADLQSQIDGVDGEYLTKEGQQDLASEVWRVRQPNADGNFRTFVNIHNGSMNLYHVADPTGADDAWAATKGYADKHLKLTGGSLTGPLDFSGAARIKAKDDDGNTNLTIYPSGLYDSKGEVRIDRPRGQDQAFVIRQDSTPKLTIRADGRAVTQYAVASSDDAGTLATKKYVDDTAGFLKPAQLAWKWGGNVSSSADPGQGNFVWQAGGSGDIIGYMRLSFISSNGCDLSDGKFNDTNVTFSYGPVGTIWQWRSDVRKWKLIMQVRAQTWRWNFNNHFEFGLSSTHGRNFSDLGANVVYHLTVGGFF